MKRQIIVAGLGRFGISLATTLANDGHDVLALDKDEEPVKSIASQITHAVQADTTNETVLKELGVKNFDIAIVAMGSEVKNSVLSTILFKKMGVPYVIARATDELHGSILEKIGADSVVYPERETGIRIAQGVTLTCVSDYMAVASGYGVAKMKASQNLEGQKLSDLGFGPKGKWEVAVLIIQREKEILVNPNQKEVIKINDTLVIAGSHDNLEKLLIEAANNHENEK